MRQTASPIASLLLVGAALVAMGVWAQTNIPVAPPQPPPLPPHWYQSVGHGVTLTKLEPVAYFRTLLGMTPTERARALAAQPEEKRTKVLAKVREYEALPREVREERMRQTELQWHLLNLLRMDTAQRKQRLAEISPLYQPMLLTQLAQWDRLPDEMRKALLAKESFLRTYVQWQGHSPSAQEDMLGHLPPQQRADWAQELNRWQGLSEGRREELCQAFRQFFYLSGEEQKETIQVLSETERRQMEQSLRSYADLPPALQRRCVESFSKFAAMSADERSQFLQNAAKWEAMTQRERQLWQTLVNRLPPMPPMPPEYYRANLPPGWPALPLPPQALDGNPVVTNMAKAP
jgi:hypothetical protein